MENNPAELIALEKKYWKTMQDHDLNAALSLTDFPCLVAGPQGARLVDQKQFTEMFEGHRSTEIKVSFEKEPEVRLLNESTAVIAYQVQSDMTTNGTTQSLVAVDTSTWIKRNGRWACAHHTETPLLQRQ